MTAVHNPPSPSEPGTPVTWTNVQAYVLAAFCLLLGVALGYLFRGSASIPAQASAAVAQSDPSAQPSGPAAQAALAEQAMPYIEAVNKNSNDYDALVKLGDLYYDAQQFPSAIQYYGRALAVHPESPDVRTDLGTAYWYSGNADRALAEIETALKYRPSHPQSLFNMGWIKWQGKSDAKGAVEAWQKLLKTNPDYPQKEQVEKYIAKAREHAARG